MHRAVKNAAATAAPSKPNPYMPALRAWDDVNGFAIAQMKRAWLVAYAAIALALLGWGGMVYYANQPRLIPFVVQTDKLDQQIAVVRAEQLRNIGQDPAILRAALRQFVINLRMVTFDPKFQKQAIELGVKPFVAAGSAAEATIKTFYTAKPCMDPTTCNNQGDPFARAKQNSTAVTVDSVVPMSPTTFQVDWTEVSQDAQGTQTGTQHWRGFFTVALHQEGTEDTILLNPAGMYVTNIQWNQVGSTGQ